MVCFFIMYVITKRIIQPPKIWNYQSLITLINTWILFLVFLTLEQKLNVSHSIYISRFQIIWNYFCWLYCKLGLQFWYYINKHKILSQYAFQCLKIALLESSQCEKLKNKKVCYSFMQNAFIKGIFTFIWRLSKTTLVISLNSLWN